MSEVAKLESQIRDFLTEPGRQDLYLKGEANWFKIVACLDTIGDTDLAMDAFLDTDGKLDWGQWYLAIYGVLQALVLQQDAIAHLAEGLRRDYAPDPSLREIREIRNDSVGHPTRRGGPPGRSFSAISRISLSKSGFRMLTTDAATTQHQMQRIDVPELIRGQREILSSSLSEILKGLERGDDVNA